MRPGEVDGVDYHFLTPDAFARAVAAGEFLEHVEYAGNRYGTLRREVDAHLVAGRSVVVEIELKGARAIRSMLPDAVTVFITPPSMSELARRLNLSSPSFRLLVQLIFFLLPSLLPLFPDLSAEKLSMSMTAHCRKSGTDPILFSAHVISHIRVSHRRQFTGGVFGRRSGRFCAIHNDFGILVRKHLRRKLREALGRQI